MTNQFPACPLPSRGLLSVGGEDRRAFLQGLISNDIVLCIPGAAIYAALLTPQGKFLHDMFVVDDGNQFLIDCEAARADDLLKRLNMYKLRAKVTLENRGSDYDVWAAWGGALPNSGGITYTDPRKSELGTRIITPKGTKPVGATETDFTTYDMHRIKLGAPDGSRDMMIGKSTLLESNLDQLNAISWSKGCYMGQELTARMHYRALVKKQLYTVQIDGPAPAGETPILIDGKEVGEMRSHCGNLGLALLQIDTAEKAKQSKTPLGPLTIL